jgi:hypothetical protein
VQPAASRQFQQQQQLQLFEHAATVCVCLLTSKWVMRGSGQVVAKDTRVTYTHKKQRIS